MGQFDDAQPTLHQPYCQPAAMAASHLHAQAHGQSDQVYQHQQQSQQSLTNGTTQIAAAVAAAADGDPVPAANHDNTTTAAAARKKRICKFPGCTRVVKSQGYCQGHGAKAKRCSVKGCDKQAQATHEGMCKRHWKLKYLPGPQDALLNGGNASTNNDNDEPQPPKSVYENVLPQSIAYRPMVAIKRDADLEKGPPWKDPLDPPTGKSSSLFCFALFFLQNLTDQKHYCPLSRILS